MKNFLTISLGLFLLAGCAEPTTQSPEADTAKKTLSAIHDFKIDEGSGVYVDEDRKALAIDAAQPNFRDTFIPAHHDVNWLESPQTYSAHLTVLSETDGESEYQVLINGQLLATVSAPETQTEFSPTIFDIGQVTLENGSRISVAATAVTNGKIPEGDGTAYSRGRWTQLTIEPIN